MTFDGRHSVKPYNRTVKLARNAHRFYAELVMRYHNGGYTPRVDEITQRQLNKAANALANYLSREQGQRLSDGGPRAFTARLAHADLATLIAMADTDEVVRLRLLRSIRDLGAG